MLIGRLCGWEGVWIGYVDRAHVDRWRAWVWIGCKVLPAVTGKSGESEECD